MKKSIKVATATVVLGSVLTLGGISTYNYQQLQLEEAIRIQLEHEMELKLQQELTKNKMAVANRMIENVNKETEIILITEKGNTDVIGNHNQDKWDWLIESEIKINVDYKAVISIPTNAINFSINPDGSVKYSYDINSISIKAIELDNKAVYTDRSIFGHKYKPEEVSALLNNAQTQIRNQIESDQSIKSNSELQLIKYLEDMAKNFGVEINNNYKHNAPKVNLSYDGNDSIPVSYYGNVKYSHPNKERTEPLKYIVIHSTSNPNKTAQDHYNYLNSNPEAKGGYHYVVDDKEVIQTLDDNMYGYAIKNTDWVKNNNSISIEIAECDNEKRQQEAIDKTIDLVVELKSKYPNSLVVSHYEATGGGEYGKKCPKILMNQKGMEWDDFIKEIEGRL